jgi:hypothetical protein
VTNSYISIKSHAKEDPRLHANKAVNGIDLSKTFRKANDLGIKPKDGKDLGHDGSGQAHVHHREAA